MPIFTRRSRTGTSQIISVRLSKNGPMVTFGLGYFSSATHFDLVIRLAQKAWRQCVLSFAYDLGSRDGNCEEVGVVKRVHTLSGGVHRLATSLKEVEEVQEEVQEVKVEWEDEEVEGNGGLKVEGEPHTSCVDEMTCATP